ncbi:MULTISPECIES: hypothetical protein [unclassified Brachybacterium]|uniref:hypothetical protein n=1 Tax=unclassified Brachybacterium TaxID=2623841 RepID=UPI00360EF76D
MTESDTSPRRGRRARALSPEESAALETRTAAAITGEQPPVPSVRGPVAPPSADAPVPTLRKFGRRARIIELSDAPEAEVAGTVESSEPAEAPDFSAADVTTSSPASGAEGAEAATEGQDVSASEDTAGTSASEQAPGAEATSGVARGGEPGDEPSTGGDPDAVDAAGAAMSRQTGQSTDTPDASHQAGQGRQSAASAPLPGAAAQVARRSQPARRTAVIDRDRDGVELGELSITDAPDPRPAPRFDGKVLHRPERSGGRPLLWLVWALIALALIVLVALLLSGVIGPGEASALDLTVHDLFNDHPHVEESTA